MNKFYDNLNIFGFANADFLTSLSLLDVNTSELSCLRVCVKFREASASARVSRAVRGRGSHRGQLPVAAVEVEAFEFDCVRGEDIRDDDGDGDDVDDEVDEEEVGDEGITDFGADASVVSVLLLLLLCVLRVFRSSPEITEERDETKFCRPVELGELIGVEGAAVEEGELPVPVVVLGEEIVMEGDVAVVVEGELPPAVVERRFEL